MTISVIVDLLVQDSEVHTKDPLWDGQGCDADPLARCKVNNPPWFTKTLPKSTKDDIELQAMEYLIVIHPLILLSCISSEMLVWKKVQCEKCEVSS